MQRNIRTALLACAAALSLGALLVSPATYAQGTMGKDDMKKNGTMKSDKKDMTPSGSMPKNDNKDMIKKDDMKK